MAANSIGCMIAYMSGSGRILAALLGIPNQMGSLIFAVPAIIVVVVIAAFAALFLSLEDLTAGSIIQQLKNAFGGGK